jgi:predicted peptidase
MKKLLFIGIAMLCAALSQCAIDKEAGTSTHSFYATDNVELNCCYYIPPDYDSSRNYPFLLALHGAGMPARDMREWIMSTIAVDIGAIVAAPDYNNVTSTEHMKYLLDSTLNYMRGSYKIDPARTILTGYSRGGKYSFDFGLDHPEKWTGIIAIAPAFKSIVMDDTLWENIEEIPMATIIGVKDHNFYYVDALMKEIPARGAKLRYIVKAGVGHNSAYFDSQEFKDDYMECYNYVLKVTSAKGL